ncbi:uncharacterized protein LOC117342507 [Pecten maximus]|uniref:uncharacterized protein LOC117342507 n=1 Tax=Pecten maximus TaxID=6579 RepID=UPI001458116E|nr:uncharacterized protein LOC117342507 [Pecten maximus]
MGTTVSQMALRMRGQTNCIQHSEKQLDFYCEQCDEVICPTCVSTTHNGHRICELSLISTKKKPYIQNFIDRTEKNELVQIRRYITSTDKLLQDNDNIFEDLSCQLKLQTEKLKQDLEKLTGKTLSLYQKMKEDNARIIQMYKQKLEMYNEQLKRKVQECKTALQRSSHIQIYDLSHDIASPSSLPVKPFLGTASFIPNMNPQHQLELALGKVMFKEVEEWNSLCGIDSICPTDDGRVWTSEYNRTLTLLDRKGRVIQRVKHRSVVSDIILSPRTHRLWVCDTDNNILELVSGHLTQRFRTKERPRCICVTASDHVIVGMARRISIFTTKGEMVSIPSAEGTGKPVVCTPHRIAECPVTHNVAVIDFSSDKDGGDGNQHVSVINTAFQELSVFRGDIPSSSDQPQTGGEPFNPWGVVFDSVGNLIIGDRDNCRVLLLSGGCKFLKVIHTDTNGTSAVGVDWEDVLWAAFSKNVKLLPYTH